MVQKLTRRVALITGPALFIIIRLIPIEGLSPEGKAVLACTAWVALWWITEAVELPVTSILPILIFPLSGALTIEQTTSAYGNPFIYLFLGGFIIGLAIENRNLHKRIAYNIIRVVGTGEKRVLLGMMVATAFLSMWISNTATAIMMLPIGVSVMNHFGNIQPFSKNLMLGIAYAASIGGIATLIGTPPNIILAGIVKESMGYEISFLDWLLFGLPFSAILLFLTWLWLTRYRVEKTDHSPALEISSLGKMTPAEKRVALIFTLTAFFWITRSFIWNKYIPGLDDTVIAIGGALLMFIIPAGEKNENLINWKEAKKLPWDVLVLFGAGLAIAKGFANTDLTVWLGAQFSLLGFMPTALIVLLILAAINFLTEITSNTATASLILPLLITLGASLHLDVLPLLAGAAISSSCAFMLPVATPPNAIVFSSGKVRIGDMVSAGLFLNITSILLTYLFIKFIWNITFQG
ncbi:MAG: DASS family sodium-coupled anion symporter [Chitinophagaceae bacterium]|nr:DASS family sodium-coupled anion symporter [Chitinophagaceae bacterium]MCZ2395222.1 DASS family sodium-coupled anion symporter [Chitinophagales bacterium]